MLLRPRQGPSALPTALTLSILLGLLLSGAETAAQTTPDSSSAPQVLLIDTAATTPHSDRWDKLKADLSIIGREGIAYLSAPVH